MMKMHNLFTDDSGSTVIETAFVIPILAMMALGGFDVSKIVARHMDLQTAVGEAESIVLASPPNDSDDRAVLEDVIEASTGLADSQVTLTSQYRCNSATALVNAVTSCNIGDTISEFITIRMTDTYSPLWTTFGVGSDVDYDISRRVQVS